MLDPFEVSIRWKKIKGFTDKIVDPILKASILEVYKQRAENDWGYCPEGKPVKKEVMQFDKYEMNLLKRIKAGKEYGVFIPDDATKADFAVNMIEYVNKGGDFMGLPKELQKRYILQAFLNVIYNNINDCITFLENN